MQTATCSFRGTFVNQHNLQQACVAIARSIATGGPARVLTYSYMVQSAVTPTIVAGVCDPGISTTIGLREGGYNAGPIAARAEAPECYPKTGVFEPCPNSRALRRRRGQQVSLEFFSIFSEDQQRIAGSVADSEAAVTQANLTPAAPRRARLARTRSFSSGRASRGRPAVAPD
jgi:hypothetical protein